MTVKGEADWKKLLYEILRSAMDDYVKLQPTKFRTKPFLRDAFDHAVGLFNDEEFRLLHVKNPDTQDYISLKEIIETLMEDDRADLNKMRDHLVKEARAFWETKLLHIVNIPDNFVYDGYVYQVLHSEEPSVNFDKKLIFIDKSIESTETQSDFIEICIQIIAYHEDLAIKQTDLKRLSKGVFKMLRMNGCFVNE